MKAKYQGLTDDAVSSIESLVGHRLPADYRSFLLSGNVYVPQDNQFTGHDVTGKVAKFLGQSAQRDEDIQVVLETYTDRVPNDLLPIALAGGGNLICLELTSGVIYFWDHEGEAGEGEVVDYRNLHRLAESFSDFLRSMDPIAVDSPNGTIVAVKLKPGFSEKFKDYK